MQTAIVCLKIPGVFLPLLECCPARSGLLSSTYQYNSGVPAIEGSFRWPIIETVVHHIHQLHKRKSSLLPSQPQSNIDRKCRIYCSPPIQSVSTMWTTSMGKGARAYSKISIRATGFIIGIDIVTRKHPKYLIHSCRQQEICQGEEHLNI